MLGLIGNIALPELLLIGALAVIIFGRRLPEVAARGYANLRRMRARLEELRRETGIDAELHHIRREVDQSMRVDLPELEGRPPFEPPPIARRATANAGDPTPTDPVATSPVPPTPFSHAEHRRQPAELAGAKGDAADTPDEGPRLETPQAPPVARTPSESEERREPAD